LGPKTGGKCVAKLVTTPDRDTHHGVPKEAKTERAIHAKLNPGFVEKTAVNDGNTHRKIS